MSRPYSSFGGLVTLDNIATYVAVSLATSYTRHVACQCQGPGLACGRWIYPVLPVDPWEHSYAGSNNHL